MRKLLTLIGLATATLAGVTHAQAQSQLSAGDLLFIQMASDAPESFSWVFTKNIKQGTTIIFTDNAWDQESDWRKDGTTGRLTENSIVWTAPNDIAAGQIQQYTDSFLALANEGDNLFAFQGPWHNPQFISGVTWSQSTGWRTSSSATSNDSYLPSGLVQGTSAYGTGIDFDNVAYQGATTVGTTATLRSAIYNTPSNWGGNETTVLTPTNGPYTFTDATPAPDASSTVAFYSFGGNASTYATSATKVNGTNGSQVSFGNFANVQVISGGNLALDADGKDGFNNQGYSTETTSTAFSLNNSVNFGTDAAFQFTMTINSGYTFDLESASFYARRNSNGPGELGLFYSLDSGSSWFQIGTTDLNLTNTEWKAFTYADGSNNYSGWTGNVLFRIYAWNASSSTSQQLQLDEIYISGVVVPEPTAASLLIFGMGALALRRRMTARK